MECKYCHQFAGFFRTAHEECEEKHQKAIIELKLEIDNCFEAANYTYDTIDGKITEIREQGYIKNEEYQALLCEQIKKNIRQNKTDNEHFLLQFVESLPDSIRSTVENDSSLVEFWKIRITNSLCISNESDTVTDELSNKIICLTSKSEKLRKEIFGIVISELENRIDSIIKDGIITESEEQSISEYIEKTNLSTYSELYQSTSYKHFVQSLVLKDLQEGKFSSRCNVTGLPILLGKTENIIWAFNQVRGYEEKTGKRYVGGSRGVSIKVCKGVYYHTGASKGHSEAYQYSADLGIGALVITNKNLIFICNKPLKIPISKIMSYTEYSDGIEIIKEATTPKSYSFVGCDAWFIINAIQLLFP